MKKSERNAIVKWAESATDEELEKEYYNCVFSSLGSQTEDMYELGYDLADIKEREQYEKFCVKSRLCSKNCATSETQSFGKSNSKRR